MMEKLSSADNSVQTEACAASGSVRFNKGSIRGQAFLYLQKPKTIEQFKRFVKRRGGSVREVLRYFRKVQVEGMHFQEEDGMLQWIVED